MRPIIFTTHGAIDEKKINTWLLGLGWVLAVLGLTCLFASFTATMATVIFFGAVLLIAGIVQLAHTLMARSEDFLFRMISGGLYCLVGVLMVVDPVSGAIGLTLLLGLFFLASGAIRLVVAFSAQRLGLSAGWHFLGAALTLLLAVVILSGWPASGNWLIGLLLGVELLFTGLTLIFFTSSAPRLQ
jgi:uncharacterized membrane protein HdeD (DUF308 family)